MVDICLGFPQLEMFHYFRTSCRLHQQGMLVRV